MATHSSVHTKNAPTAAPSLDDIALRPPSGTVTLIRDTTVPLAEFEKLREDPGKREDLLREIARHILAPGYQRWISKYNSRRDSALIYNDCLVAIDRLIASFDPNHGKSLERYIRSNLLHRVIEVWRKETPRGPSAQSLESAESLAQPDPTDHHAAIERRDDSKQLLRRLTAFQRRIVHSRLRGYDFSDIATRLGVSETKIFDQLREIRTTLRRADKQTLVRSDFERFVSRLVDSDKGEQPATLADFVTGPEFFASYLPAMRTVFAFKRTVAASYTKGIDVLGAASTHLARYLEQTYGGIDMVPSQELGPITRLVGVKKNLPALLIGLYQRGACTLTPPGDPRWHSGARFRNRRSLYFDPNVVGLERATSNINAHLKVLIPDLSFLRDKQLVLYAANLLAADPRPDTVGRACIERGILSGVLPHFTQRDAESPAHDPWEVRSLYFKSSVVGEELAGANLQNAVRRRYRSLNEVTRSPALSKILGCPDSAVAIAHVLAAEHLLGRTPPIGSALIRPDGSLSRYTDPRFVGAAARANFERLFRASFQTVDDLPTTQYPLSQALGSSNTLRGMAQAAIEQRLIPGVLPPGHPWYRPNGTRSRYFSPAVVGTERALASTRAALGPLVPKLDLILDLEEAARVLGVPPSERGVARRCLTLGLVDGRAEPTTPILRPDGELSFHLDPRIRRRHLALEDLRLIVEAQQLSLEDLTRIPKLSLLLRCEPSPSGITSGLYRAAIQPYENVVPQSLSFNRALHPAFNKTITPPERWRSNMRAYLAANYRSLDELQRDRLLAEALGCSETARDIAQAVIKHGLMSWLIPRDSSLFGMPGGSYYVDGAVMEDIRRINLNIRRSLRGRVSTLDDISQNEALASALGCPKNATAIAAALAERNILSTKLPPQHPFTIGHVRSRYFDPAVVGYSQVTKNVEVFLAREAPTLDDLPMIDALCNTLNVDRRRHALAQYVVHFQLVDWRLPHGHEVSRAGGSLYLNPTIMNRAQIDANVRTLLIDRYGGNLDALPPKSKALSSALQVDNNRGAIARAIIERGILPPRPPREHTPHTVRGSIYFNRDIVGLEHAAFNRAAVRR